MNLDKITARYLEKLFEGDRIGCRNILGEALQTGTPARIIYTDLFWNAMSVVENRYREHAIDIVTEHMATRINRTLVDQLQSKLPRSDSRDMKMIIACSDDEPEELGAQMCADLFESDGWEVKFLGGGLTNDDILAFTNEHAPDILLIYGTAPKQAPTIRRLIDTIKDINAWSNMRIMVSGGLFNRAEGLWQEMGADMYAATATDAIQQASCENPIDIEVCRTINRRKRRHRQKS